MPRYIDAEKIEYNYKYGNVMFFAQKEQIDEIPTADVAPVVHGHWIKLDRRKNCLGWKYECSRCVGWAMNEYIFCPHCGAKMDEEQEKCGG